MDVACVLRKLFVAILQSRNFEGSLLQCMLVKHVNACLLHAL